MPVQDLAVADPVRGQRPGRVERFLIQAADSNQVYESQPRPVRGAVCHR